MRLRTDARGSAGTGFNFLLALGAGALLSLMLRQIALPFVEKGRAATTDPTATTALGYTETAVRYWPAVILLTAFFYFVGQAVIDRGVGV
mgnify:CR=1 FL=1